MNRWHTADAGTPSKSLVQNTPQTWGLLLHFNGPDVPPLREALPGTPSQPAGTVLCTTRARNPCLYSWKHALTRSSHLVKFVPSLRLNSLLYTWLMWNPAEHYHTASGVSEVKEMPFADRCGERRVLLTETR